MPNAIARPAGRFWNSHRRRWIGAVLWLIWIGGFPRVLSAQEIERDTWNWSEAACLSVTTVPVVLQWSWDRVESLQMLPFEGTWVRWMLTGPRAFPDGPHHYEGYTLWLQTPDGTVMDLLAMEPLNQTRMHAEFTATMPGEYCGYARAVGTFALPTTGLHPPGKPIVKGL